MTRRPRLKSLPEPQRADLILLLEKLNGTVVDCMRMVAPQSEEYRSMVAFQDSIIAAIRAMGREPTWMEPRR